MAKVNLDVAMQSTSEEILEKVGSLEAVLNAEVTANVVKKILRGTASTTSVTIEKVNPDKCLVFCEGGYYSGGDNTFGSPFWYTGLTETSITFGYWGNGCKGHWQLIEFY